MILSVLLFKPGLHPATWNYEFVAGNRSTVQSASAHCKTSVGSVAHDPECMVDSLRVILSVWLSLQRQSLMKEACGMTSKVMALAI